MRRSWQALAEADLLIRLQLIALRVGVGGVGHLQCGLSVKKYTGLAKPSWA